jgi:thioesterase domain-containing protein
MAANYLPEIRRVQPRGPYRLGGASFGGVVAFEMARQLRRQGQQVATLFLLGSYVWNNPHREAAAAEGGTLPTRVRRRLARLLPAEARAAAWQQRPDGTMPASVLQRGVNLLALAKGEIAWRWAALGRRAIAPKTIHDRYLRASRLLISQYWPGDYEGRVVFFRATDDRDPVPVWQGLAAGGFALHEVEGRHTDLMREPMVDAVADLMRGYIDRADLEQATAVPACAAEAVPPACS